MSSLPPRHQLDAINQNCYDNCFTYWDRFPFPDCLPDLIKTYQPHTNHCLLDIGCGTGMFAHWMQEQGFKVLGLDPSPKMISLCQAKGLDCLRITFQDFQSAAFFSIITAILSFIHIPKKEWPDQLNKVAQLLSSDGLFILALIEGEKEAIQETSTGFPRFFSYFTKEEVLQLTEKKFKLLCFHVYPAPKSNYLLFAFQKI